jgi:hypothetical protein
MGYVVLGGTVNAQAVLEIFGLHPVPLPLTFQKIEPRRRASAIFLCYFAPPP